MKFKSFSQKNRPLYIEATIFLIVYALASHFILLESAAFHNFFLAFLIPSLTGIIGSVVLLYLFSHEDFFKFARFIEVKEREYEKKWLKRLVHSGKIFASFAMGIIGGPIFGALTVRLLLKNYKYRYPLVAAINIPSALIYVGLMKVAFNMIF